MTGAFSVMTPGEAAEAAEAVARLRAHLAQGHGTVCRAWALRRSDGRVLGFTDHDRALAFDGIEFRPDSGLSASAVEQMTGLSVDNAEILGALSDRAIRAEDIAAGLYDGAQVRCWQVNWADPGQRQALFAGSLGEIRQTGGAFRAELRGLTEALNTPWGGCSRRPAMRFWGIPPVRSTCPARAVVCRPRCGLATGGRGSRPRRWTGSRRGGLPMGGCRCWTVRAQACGRRSGRTAPCQGGEALTCGRRWPAPSRRVPG